MDASAVPTPGEDEAAAPAVDAAEAVDVRDRARRFLDAFHGIEQVMRKRVDWTGTHPPGFAHLVKHSGNLLTAEQRERLLELADLRNAIAHHPFTPDGRPWADPREETVVWIEAQLEVIDDPPHVLRVLKLEKPATFSHDDDVKRFLDEAVARDDYSQAPYRDAEGHLQLITTNAVTRWIAANYTSSDGVMVEHEKIGHIAGNYSEHNDWVALASREMHAAEALNLFAGSKDHHPPAAIIITENGHQKDTPLGLVSPWDIPALSASLFL